MPDATADDMSDEQQDALFDDEAQRGSDEGSSASSDDSRPSFASGGPSFASGRATAPYERDLPSADSDDDYAES